MSHDQALAAVLFRENLIERAKQLVIYVNSNRLAEASGEKKVSGASNFIAHEIVSLANELRDNGLRCVTRITSWMLAKTTSHSESTSAPCFMYRGEEYLVKMLHDLDFISENLRKPPFARADPLVILKETNLDQTSKRSATAATLVILDAVARKHRADRAMGTAALAKEIEIVPNRIEKGVSSSGSQQEGNFNLLDKKTNLIEKIS